MEIKGLTAIVTGGASGLGGATARMLVEAGANAAILDMDEERGAGLASELGPAAAFFKADVTDGESVAAAIAGALEKFGPIRVTVSCAGIVVAAKVVGRDGPMDLSLFSKGIQVNLIGTFNVMRLAADKMLQNDPNADGERGVIVNTSSIAAYEGQIGQTSYAASKAGVIGLTLPAAREFAPKGIRVMTIAPGIFDTPMMAGMPENVKEALGQSVPFPPRLGRPPEYAALVRQIIENPLLNGETIRLDGALRMQAR